MNYTKVIGLVALLLVAFSFASCTKTETTETENSNTETQTTSTETTDSNKEGSGEVEKQFTKKELAEFDGKEGRPAYVAVDGVVYDVTGLGTWTDGKHNGVLAGKDLTNEIKNISPHGVSKLKGLTVVGKLVD